MCKLGVEHLVQRGPRSRDAPRTVLLVDIAQAEPLTPAEAAVERLAAVERREGRLRQRFAPDIRERHEVLSIAADAMQQHDQRSRRSRGGCEPPAVVELFPGHRLHPFTFILRGAHRGPCAAARSGIAREGGSIRRAPYFCVLFTQNVCGAQHLTSAHGSALDNAFLIRSAPRAWAPGRCRSALATIIAMMRRASLPGNRCRATPFHRRRPA